MFRDESFNILSGDRIEEKIYGLSKSTSKNKLRNFYRMFRRDLKNSHARQKNKLKYLNPDQNNVMFYEDKIFDDVSFWYKPEEIENKLFQSDATHRGTYKTNRNCNQECEDMKIQHTCGGIMLENNNTHLESAIELGNKNQDMRESCHNVDSISSDDDSCIYTSATSLYHSSHDEMYHSSHDEMYHSAEEFASFYPENENSERDSGVLSNFSCYTNDPEALQYHYHQVYTGNEILASGPKCGVYTGKGTESDTIMNDKTNHTVYHTNSRTNGQSDIVGISRFYSDSYINIVEYHNLTKKSKIWRRLRSSMPDVSNFLSLDNDITGINDHNKLVPIYAVKFPLSLSYCKKERLQTSTYRGMNTTGRYNSPRRFRRQLEELHHGIHERVRMDECDNHVATCNIFVNRYLQGDVTAKCSIVNNTKYKQNESMRNDHIPLKITSNVNTQNITEGTPSKKQYCSTETGDINMDKNSKNYFNKERLLKQINNKYISNCKVQNWKLIEQYQYALKDIGNLFIPPFVDISEDVKNNLNTTLTSNSISNTCISNPLAIDSFNTDIVQPTAQYIIDDDANASFNEISIESTTNNSDAHNFDVSRNPMTGQNKATGFLHRFCRKLKKTRVHDATYTLTVKGHASIKFEDELESFFPDSNETNEFISKCKDSQRVTFETNEYDITEPIIEVYGKHESNEEEYKNLTDFPILQRRDSKYWRIEQKRQEVMLCCKKTFAFLFSHIGLVSIVLAYCIMGGFLFRAIEKSNEVKQQNAVKEYRENAITKIKTHAYNIKPTKLSQNNFSKLVEYELKIFESYVFNATKNLGWNGNDSISGDDSTSQWSYSSSILFAITVMTTIGYGHVAPRTVLGRIVTIAYAVVGIPLTLLCLTNIGDLMAKGFRWLYSKVCCQWCCIFFRKYPGRPPDIEKGVVRVTFGQESDKPNEIIHVPTSLCLLIIALYIIAGATLFTLWEEWDMLAASYFCFITLSTIGFGDIVPGTNWMDESKLVICALYLVVGLSLIAMCFTLVQEDVKNKCRWIGQKIGILERDQL